MTLGLFDSQGHFKVAISSMRNMPLVKLFPLSCASGFLIVDLHWFDWMRSDQVNCVCSSLDRTKHYHIELNYFTHKKNTCTMCI